jgi:glucose/arabinose dehydrogenase
MRPQAAFGLGLLAFALAACGESAKLPDEASVGPNPEIPAPSKTLIPTVNVATATGWGEQGAPKAAAGLAVAAFANGLDHPRSVLVLPNGDVLVAETNAPERPDDAKGPKGMAFRYFQKKAGAGPKSANRITLLRDRDGDGVAETRTEFLKNLNSPFGMVLVGTTLYVANTDAVMAFPYQEGATSITDPGKKIADLPAGTINHHWTKGLAANRDGTKLYASVGSNSNAAENGLKAEDRRAAILEIALPDGQTRLFASGLRNPVDLAFAPQSDTLWAVVNERDELGSDLVPDYLTSVKDGGFYGWPFSYWGQHVDDRVPAHPDMVAKAIVPDYALGNHVAPLGLTFAEGARLTDAFREGVFIGEHGSWNRKPRSGYKVVFVPFANGRPNGPPGDVLTGFIDDKDQAMGRPVRVAIDKTGALLVADDVGNTIWRVTAGAQAAARQ